LVVAACAPRGSAKRAFVADIPSERALMEADRDFARETSRRGITGWLDAFADDGVLLPANEPVAKGKVAVRAVMAGLLADPTTHLRWEPSSASVAASGDLGYTLGHATFSKSDPAGQEFVFAKLKYTTVWKRQADGRWKVAVNIGTVEP
jgi:ketosteroid isomerase-like protein